MTPSPPATVTAGPVPAVARDFAWADGDTGPFYVAACLTVVRGLSPREALRTLLPGRRVTSARAARRAAEQDPVSPDGSGHYSQWVVAGTRGGWTFLLEDNGFLATANRITRALSRRGTAVVLYRNVNALEDFRYARNGRTIRAFDPLLYSPSVGRVLPAERGLPFGEEKAGIFHSMALAMTLTRRLTGLRIRPADVRPDAFTLGAIARY